jgi:hypothetical protein
LQGRKSVERPYFLRKTEGLFCLFGSGSSGLGWYSLIIPSTIEMAIPGKWVNGVQLTGFVAAYIVPPGVLFWSLYKRRKEYRSRQKVGTAQA